MAFNSRERNLVALTCFGHFVCHLGLLIFPGALLLIKQEFGLSPFTVSVLPLLGYMLLGVGALPAGVLVDRWSARHMLVVYFGLMAIFATSVSVARSAASLLLLLTLLGACASIYHPTGLTLISHEVRLRGKAMGIHGIAGSLGVALGPFLGLYLGGSLSWRSAYLAVGGMAVLGFLWALLYCRTEEKRIPERSTPDGTGPLRRFLPLLYLAMILGGLSYRSLVTVLPAFIVGEGEKVEKGAFPTLVILLMGGIGQFSGGRLSDVIRPVLLYSFLVALAIPFALVIALGLFPPILPACALAFFLFSVQPVENHLLASASSPARRATLYALKFAPAFAIGAFGTAIVGAVWDITGGLRGVFLCLVLLLTGMLLIVGWAAYASRSPQVDLEKES